MLPRVISEVHNGRTDTLGLLFTTFLINGEFISTGMYRSVQCREELAFSDLTAVEASVAIEPRLVEYFDGWEFAYEACDVWGSGVADDIENRPVVSDIPTLVMTGEYDPITPPAWGEMVADNLTAEYLVDFPAIGHGATSSGDCPLGVALAFLENPTAAPDTSCERDMGSPSFDTPDNLLGEEIELIPFESDLGVAQIRGVVPQGWEESLPGTFTRGANGLDQTALIYQLVPLGNVTPAEFTSFIFNQLSADVTWNPESYVDYFDREWTITRGDTQGLPLAVATVEDDRYLYAVILLTNFGEDEDIRPAVMFPALDEVGVIE